LLPFAAFYMGAHGMAWHGMYLCCGWAARQNRAIWRQTHTLTLRWPRAHTLLSNNADDMVLALTNFVFCCSSELVLV
jgi:hypothetical protein